MAQTRRRRSILTSGCARPSTPRARSRNSTQPIGDSSAAFAEDFHMTATIELAFVVFGIALLFWAITATNKSAGARAAAGSVGFIALLLALFLRSSDDSHDWRDRS